MSKEIVPTINGKSYPNLEWVNIIDIEIHCPKCGEYINRRDNPLLHERSHTCTYCDIDWWVETNVVVNLSHRLDNLKENSDKIQ